MSMGVCMRTTVNALRARFSDIQHVNTSRVKQLMLEQSGGAEGGSQPPVILVDARAAGEFAVSRLPGAVCIGHDVSDSELVDKLDQALQKKHYLMKSPTAALSESVGAGEGARGPAPGPTVVCYCSLGYRSALLARRIVANPDFASCRVFNMEGSIFQWANEGGALEGSAGVHPYNTVAGRLLNKQLWRFEPDSHVPSDSPRQ